MKKRKARKFLFAVACSGILGVSFFVTTNFNTFLAPAAVSFSRADIVDISPPPPRVEHKATPSAVKAVYMSQCAAGTQSFRDMLFKLVDETEINAIVVDLKDYTGTVAFPSETAVPAGKGCTVSDFRELVKEMHRRDIYVIGRLTVFQDPLYTKKYPEFAVKKKSDGSTWHDYKGLAFVDVGAQPFWAYVVSLAREAHAFGVDEINFDYIRYPSDGPMRDVSYTYSTESEQENLERFFAYLSHEVRVEEDGHIPLLSADLFGMTTTNTDDLNIGQVLERTMPYFDYVAPMVYPSHYPPGFNGWQNPNSHVYGVVNFSMGSAVKRAEATTTPNIWLRAERIGTSTPAVYTKKAYPRNILRPWLQDFDYGGDYGPKEVRDQIQASYDVGLTSWMLWSPSNRYTREALKE